MASGCQFSSRSLAVVLDIRACTAALKILVYQRWRSSPLGKAEVALDFISNLATHNLEVRRAMIDAIDHLREDVKPGQFTQVIAGEGTYLKKIQETKVLIQKIQLLLHPRIQPYNQISPNMSIFRIWASGPFRRTI